MEHRSEVRKFVALAGPFRRPMIGVQNIAKPLRSSAEQEAFGTNGDLDVIDTALVTQAPNQGQS